MTLAILQVRMTTPRLPGKALAPLRGEPMVWRQLERIHQARTVRKVVVATSDEPADDILTAFLLSRGQTVFRGSAGDLTGRFMRCLEAAGPVAHVVRLKGDSPFVDPGIINATVRLARASGADYTSNRVRRSFPRGVEVEVAATAALWDSARNVDPVTATQISPMATARPAGPLAPRPSRRGPRLVGPRLAHQDPRGPRVRRWCLCGPARRRPGLFHGRRARPAAGPPGHRPLGRLTSLSRAGARPRRGCGRARRSRRPPGGARRPGSPAGRSG